VAGGRSGQDVLDVLVQSRRNTKAAKRFVGKLIRKQCRALRVLATDRHASYVVAHRELMPSVEHPRSKYLNNRAETRTNPPDSANGRWSHLAALPTRPT
jgi:putative transposase